MNQNFISYLFLNRRTTYVMFDEILMKVYKINQCSNEYTDGMLTLNANNTYCFNQ